jgi:Putative auto-transporter adhesin, head GIN domain
MRATRVALLASLVVAIGAASVSCTRDRIRGSGNVVARDVTVASFSRLEVGSAFEVTVSLGGQPSLTLRIDDNLDRHVDVGVDGDTLHIGLRRGTSVSDATLQAAVTAPSLARIQGSGSSRIRLQDPLAGDDLRLELSGASRLDGAAELRSMTAGLSGASELTLSGRVGTVSANASGASRLALEQLQVDALEVGLSGASNAEVWVRRTISASLSGASSLRYRGSPTLTTQETSGGSSITRMP